MARMIRLEQRSAKNVNAIGRCVKSPCRLLALFANSLRCNGASAAEGRPTVARLASSRQPVTLSCRAVNWGPG